MATIAAAHPRCRRRLLRRRASALPRLAARFLLIIGARAFHDDRRLQVKRRSRDTSDRVRARTEHAQKISEVRERVLNVNHKNRGRRRRRARGLISRPSLLLHPPNECEATGWLARRV